MDKIIKIFEVNDEIRSYRYPIIKILICIMVIVCLINRDQFFVFEEKRETIFVTVVSFILGVLCIFCINISIVEIFELHDRRVDNQRNVAEVVAKQYPIESIISWLEKEDVIEIQIKVQEDIVMIGSTSDNKWSTNIFFDKVYYCDEKEYESIEVFREAINAYAVNEMLEVVSIDGITQ